MRKTPPEMERCRIKKDLDFGLHPKIMKDQWRRARKEQEGDWYLYD